jgi:Tfp pilus assembly protein PilF
MFRLRTGLLAAAAVAAVLAAAPAVEGQVGSSIRGVVVDDKGQPIPDVNVEFVFKGESRVKIVKNTRSDKKGRWARVGLQSGPWVVSFTKAGYKPHSLDTYTGGDALAELPPVTLATAAAGEKTATSEAEVEAERIRKQKEAALGKTYNQAVAALQAGDLATAETLFQQVLVEKPDVGAAHHNLAFIALKKGDAKAAEASYRKAIELAPAESAAYLALAALLAEQGRTADAYQLLNGVAANFPLDGQFQFVLGVTASNSGKDAEALAAFTKAAELDPANIETEYYLGTAAVASDQAKAIAHLEKYVAAAPETSPNRPTAVALLDALKKKK